GDPDDLDLRGHHDRVDWANGDGLHAALRSAANASHRAPLIFLTLRPFTRTRTVPWAWFRAVCASRSAFCAAVGADFLPMSSSLRPSHAAKSVLHSSSSPCRRARTAMCSAARAPNARRAFCASL